jgi:hypothetical protein
MLLDIYTVWSGLYCRLFGRTCYLHLQGRRKSVRECHVIIGRRSNRNCGKRTGASALSGSVGQWMEIGRARASVPPPPPGYVAPPKYITWTLIYTICFISEDGGRMFIRNLGNSPLSQSANTHVEGGYKFLKCALLCLGLHVINLLEWDFT